MVIPEKKILTGYPVTLTPDATEAGFVKLDMANFRLAREFHITGKIATNATAPGNGKGIIINYYWSDDDLPATAATAVELLGRKTSLSSASIVSVASATQYFQFSSTPIRMTARYLYISYKFSAMWDSGATAALTLSVVSVPSTAVDI